MELKPLCIVLQRIRKRIQLFSVSEAFFNFYSLALDDRPNCIIYLFLCFHRVLLDSRILISRIISREPQQKRPIIYQNCSFEFRTTKLHIYARNKQNNCSSKELIFERTTLNFFKIKSKMLTAILRKRLDLCRNQGIKLGILQVKSRKNDYTSSISVYGNMDI